MNELILLLVALAAILMTTRSIRARKLEESLRPIRISTRGQNRRSV